VGRSLLKIRLEVSKRISNARLDFTDRVFDRRPIFEQYLAGDVDLHVHFLAGERMWCLTSNAPTSAEVFFQSGVNSDPDLSTAGDNMPVLVHVGEIAEPPRPVASIIWLQPFNCCDMNGVDGMALPRPAKSFAASITGN
jgi:hypothetical protein